MNFIEHNWEHVLAGLGALSILLHAVEGGCAAAGWTKYQGIFNQVYRFIQGFLGNVKPPTPPTAGLAALFIIVACGASYADVTGTQAVLYLNKDHSIVQATVFEVIKSKPIASLGKWNALVEGWSVDVGGAYDDTKVLKNGVVLLGKDFGVLANYLPISFPLSDKLVIKAYFIGAYCEDIWTTPKLQTTEGVGYVSATLKF